MVERVAEEVRQPHHHVTGDGRLLDSGHIGHALQRVEEKMRVDLALQLRKAALLDQLPQACCLALLLTQGFFQLCFAFQCVNRPRDLVLEVVERVGEHTDLVRACKVEVLNVVFAIRDAACTAAHLLHRQQQAACVVQHRACKQHAADRGYDGKYHVLRGTPLTEDQIALASLHQKRRRQLIGVLRQIAALCTQSFVVHRVKCAVMQLRDERLLTDTIAFHRAVDDLLEHLALRAAVGLCAAQPLPRRGGVLHGVRIFVDRIGLGRRKRQLAQKRIFLLHGVHVVRAACIFRQDIIAFLAVIVKIVH